MSRLFGGFVQNCKAVRMKELRSRIRKARTIVVEHDAAVALDYLSAKHENFGDVWREVENVLAERPDEIGIQGLICDGIGLGYYLHSSEQIPSFNVLYRYDKENVYLDSISVIEPRLKLAG
jgi:hypothetical protein